MTDDPDQPNDAAQTGPPERAEHTPPKPAGPAPIPCANCGYDIRGTRIGEACPECGIMISLAPHRDAASGKAVASLVLGILSLVTCMYYGLPGLICGILALIYAKQVRRITDEGNASAISVSMGKAGRVCGMVGVILSSIFFVLMALYIVFIIGIVGAAAWGGGGGARPPAPVPFP